MRTSREIATLMAVAASLLGGCGSSITVGADASTCDAPADATHDAYDAGLGCAALVRCLNPCADPACVTRCRAQASPEGLRLAQAQTACVFGSPTAQPPVTGACPSTGGGVCDAAHAGYSSATCSQCVDLAQRVGGACDAEVVACQHSP